MGKPGTIGPANPDAKPTPDWLKKSDKSWGWEAAAICQVAGAAGGGGGVFLFLFRSYAHWKMVEPFLFIAGGVGLGGSLGGASLPDLSTAKVSYSPLTVRKAFSVYDLNGSFGFLGAGGVAVVAGYTVMTVNAFNTQGFLFDSSDCSGWSAGFSLNVFGMMGYWRSLPMWSSDSLKRLKKLSM